MTIRLGAVGYLNARPLVFELDRSPRFQLRFDVPAECARLLQAGEIELGLIPSVEYFRNPGYCIVPDLAIASRGAVASVAIFSSRPMQDVRTLVMDTSSRTSVALARIFCGRLFGIQPAIETMAPNLEAMLGRGDAALVIGDNALLRSPEADRQQGIQKIDLGEAWTAMTGLPFVWAVWAGLPGRLTGDDVYRLQEARDRGEREPDPIARAYFPDSVAHQVTGARYLRDNIKYHLGPDEREALERFSRYALEDGLVPAAGPLRFYS